MSNPGIDLRINIENASISEKIAMIDNLYTKWVLKNIKNENNIFECLKIAIRNFGLDIETFQAGNFERAVAYAMTEISYLRLYGLELEEDLGPHEGDRKALYSKINIISKIIVSADNAIRYNFKLQNSFTDNLLKNEKGDLCDFTPIDTSNTTAYQNLLLYLLENLARKGFRRYNGSCYEKIYTNKTGFDTHCWKESMTLEDFIYESVRKDTHFEMWQNLTSNKGNVPGAIEYLCHHRGVEFEDIKKDRHVFSFNDGIYLTKKKEDGMWVDEFMPYNGKKISVDITGCNYFDLDFDESTRPRKEQNYRFNDWWAIIEDKCPLFQSIMTYQEWEIDVQKWLCILIGRCLYNVNELDGWQVIPFLLGQAGSGKSTVVNFILKKFYEACDVGILSNNVEVKFGLEGLYDKTVFIAPEVKGNLKLEQAEFQSIVSGESISVARKNRLPVTIMWPVPGMLAGNEVPNYSDNSGSISRRLLTFLFNKKVKKGDTQLGNKLEKELAYIMQACNRAYLEAVNNHGSEDVWNILPQYFIKSRDEMAETTNALTSFLKSDRVKLSKELYTRETNFVESFNEHCRDMNIPKQRWNGQFCMGPFSNFEIEVERNVRRDGITGTVFVGVGIIIPVRTNEDGTPIKPIEERNDE